MKHIERTDPGEDLRNQVRSLVPLFEELQDLGKSLVAAGSSLSAQERILKYFLSNPGVPIHYKEVAIVAGISEWARRIRELRVEHGWRILNGAELRDMIAEGEYEDEGLTLEKVGREDYILFTAKQDREAAFRWKLANQIRRKETGAKQKILEFLRKNVGKPVRGDELRYVTNNVSNWARRVRELRTEEGWPISTYASGRPDLPIGEYLLEEDRQIPRHDRRIPDSTRRAVLMRDKYTCQKCSWNHSLWNRSDPRFLEVHHVRFHSEGGDSQPGNLITYCNVCHDEIHRQASKGEKDLQ